MHQMTALLTDVAAAHAAALDPQIRVLRVQKAVLQAVAHRGSDPKELQTMHRLAQRRPERAHSTGAPGAK